MTDEMKKTEVATETTEQATTESVSENNESTTKQTNEMVTIGETGLVEKKPGTLIIVPAGANAEDVIAALENSPESMDKKGEILCRWAAGRASVIVLAPFLGTVALMANEFYLVNRLAKVYGKDVSDGAIVGFLGAFGGTLAGNLLATLIPFGVVQVPIAVGVTYAVGKVAQAWIRDGMPKNMAPYLELYKEWSEKAKSEVKILAEDPLKNIPLGDETKDYILDSGARLKDAIGEMKDKMTENLAAGRDKVQVRQAELADKAAIGSEEFRQKATETIQNAKTIAVEGSQKLREKATIGAEILKEKATVGAEVIKEKASASAEVIKEKASVGAELIKEKSKQAAEGATEVINTATEKAGALAETAKDKFRKPPVEGEEAPTVASGTEVEKSNTEQEVHKEEPK